MQRTAAGTYFENDRFTVVAVTKDGVTLDMVRGNSRGQITVKMTEFASSQHEHLKNLRPGDKVFRGNCYFYFAQQPEFA